MLSNGKIHFRSIPGECFLALAVAAFLFPGATHSRARQVEVVYVYDGDTIKVTDDQTDCRIRLAGIDAPEISKGKPGQPYSQKARNHLIRLVLHQQVEIQTYGTDVYNRILAVVRLDGKNINLEMIRAGLAEADGMRETQRPDMKPYRAAQEEARSARRGMWSLGEKYVSPSRWRRTHW